MENWCVVFFYLDQFSMMGIGQKNLLLCYGLKFHPTQPPGNKVAQFLHCRTLQHILSNQKKVMQQPAWY